MKPWYMEPDEYDRILSATSLSEDDYLRALRQVHSVFSLRWAAAELETIRGSGVILATTLRPPLERWYPYHPAPPIIAGIGRSIRTVCELIRLGNDLMVTKQVPRLRRKRRELRLQDQFAPRLFEFEMLAALIRAGLSPKPIPEGGNAAPDFEIDIAGVTLFVEARYRGALFARAVESQLSPPWGIEPAWGELRIELLTDGDRNEKPDLVASQINDEIERILTAGDLLAPMQVAGPLYEVRYDPDGRDRTVTMVGLETEAAYTAELAATVHAVLRKKEEHQLRQRASKGHPCVVALDCRPIVPAIAGHSIAQRPDQAAQPERRREAILRAISAFLNESSAVAGVLTVWSKYDLSEGSYRGWLEDPYTLTFNSATKSLPIPSPRALGDQLRWLGMSRKC